MSQIKLKHSGGNSSIIAAPSSNPASDVTFRLPNADGSANQFMKTDGSGNLAFASVAVGGSSNIAFNSGNGIDFSATSGTGTSELFSDYEEGTFTPDWKGGSALGTTSYGSHNIGAYTKIGNLVTVTGKSDITGTSGGSGFWFIGNMPFNVASGQEHNTVGAVRLDYFTFSSGDKREVTDIITTMDQNNNNMHIHNIRHNTYLGSSVGANVDANFSVYWCITYRTA